MTKIDIFSGFLGAGKTTLIKKLIKEAYAGEQIVLIENEFGEIGIDGGFMQEAGIQVNEMNSGCICCSLVGDFGKALKEVIAQYHPDRILIEPSGVGKLSDVVAAVKRVMTDEVQLGATVTVVDANKVKVYMKNFGEFYANQVEHTDTIILSRTDNVPEAKLDAAMALLREQNDHAVIITTPWPELSGKQILEAMEQQDTLAHALSELKEEHHHHEHHHHEHHEHEDEHHHEHHEHDEHCTCGCHDHEHEHHHDHEHYHEHDHGEDCTCGCHDHEHHDHGHHHADEVFQSWGVETHKKFDAAVLSSCLAALEQEALYGAVLRAKGIVQAIDGSWLHFDFVPGDYEVRKGCAGVTGRLCVIGAGLKEEKLKALFEV